MPSFASQFAESGGEPIEFENGLLYARDKFPVDSCRKFDVAIEATNSKWRQGFRIFAENVEIHVNEMKVQGEVTFWEDTAPESFGFSISGETSHIEVWNVWDTGNGITQAWVNGAAMRIEEIPDGRRYCCNDGFPDDDFDDIIFTIVRTSDR